MSRPLTRADREANREAARNFDYYDDGEPAPEPEPPKCKCWLKDGELIMVVAGCPIHPVPKS